MIHTEAWYRESQTESEYQRLLELWRRSLKMKDQSDEVQDAYPQLLGEDYQTQLLEQLFRLHRRLGKPKEGIVQILLELDYEWDWPEIVSKIPSELFPPVTFQVVFFIERYIDTDSEGVPGVGYINQNKEMYGASPYLEGEARPWTMPVAEFFQMLESQGWSGWHDGSYLLSESRLFDKDAISLELDSRNDGDDARLKAFSPDLYHYRNNIIYHWRYSEWYSDSEDELPEEYLEEMGGWITTLQIHPPEGDTRYFDLVLDWAKEAVNL